MITQEGSRSPLIFIGIYTTSNELNAVTFHLDFDMGLLEGVYDPWRDELEEILLSLFASDLETSRVIVERITNEETVFRNLICLVEKGEQTKFLAVGTSYLLSERERSWIREVLSHIDPETLSFSPQIIAKRFLDSRFSALSVLLSATYPIQRTSIPLVVQHACDHCSLRQFPTLSHEELTELELLAERALMAPLSNLGDALHKANLLLRLGQHLLVDGKNQEAIDVARQASVLMKTASSTLIANKLELDAAILQYNYAIILEDIGAVEEARNLYESAANIAFQYQAYILWIVATLIIIDISIAQSMFDIAKHKIQQLSAYEQANIPREYRPLLDVYYGKILREEGSFLQAHEHLLNALISYEGKTMELGIITELSYELGKINTKLYAYEKATQYLMNASRLLEMQGNEQEAARILDEVRRLKKEAADYLSITCLTLAHDGKNEDAQSYAVRGVLSLIAYLKDELYAIPGQKVSESFILTVVAMLERFIYALKLSKSRSVEILLKRLEELCELVTSKEINFQESFNILNSLVEQSMVLLPASKWGFLLFHKDGRKIMGYSIQEHFNATPEYHPTPEVAADLFGAGLSALTAIFQEALSDTSVVRIMDFGNVKIHVEYGVFTVAIFIFTQELDAVRPYLREFIEAVESTYAPKLRNWKGGKLLREEVQDMFNQKLLPKLRLIIDNFKIPIDEAEPLSPLGRLNLLLAKTRRAHSLRNNNEVLAIIERTLPLIESLSLEEITADRTGAQFIEFLLIYNYLSPAKSLLSRIFSASDIKFPNILVLGDFLRLRGHFSLQSFSPFEAWYYFAEASLLASGISELEEYHNNILKDQLFASIIAGNTDSATSLIDTLESTTLGKSMLIESLDLQILKQYFIYLTSEATPNIPLTMFHSEFHEDVLSHQYEGLRVRLHASMTALIENIRSASSMFGNLLSPDNPIGLRERFLGLITSLFLDLCSDENEIQIIGKLHEIRYLFEKSGFHIIETFEKLIYAIHTLRQNKIPDVDGEEILASILAIEDVELQQWGLIFLGILLHHRVVSNAVINQFLSRVKNILNSTRGFLTPLLFLARAILEPNESEKIKLLRQALEKSQLHNQQGVTGIIYSLLAALENEPAFKIQGKLMIEENSMFGGLYLFAHMV